MNSYIQKCVLIVYNFYAGNIIHAIIYVKNAIEKLIYKNS